MSPFDWRKFHKSRIEPNHRQDKDKCIKSIVGFTDVQHLLVIKSWEVVLLPYPEKNGLWITSIGTAWELFRNAEFQAPLQTYWTRICSVTAQGCSRPSWKSTSVQGLVFWRGAYQNQLGKLVKEKAPPGESIMPTLVFLLLMRIVITYFWGFGEGKWLQIIDLRL